MGITRLAYKMVNWIVDGFQPTGLKARELSRPFFDMEDVFSMGIIP